MTKQLVSQEQHGSNVCSQTFYICLHDTYYDYDVYYATNDINGCSSLKKGCVI